MTENEFKLEYTTLKGAFPYGLTETQEETIRQLAARMGYETLRGFGQKLRSVEWTYYDILEAESP